MLRSIKHPSLSPRLIGISAETAASATNTVSVGRDEGGYTNAVADHRLDLALKNPFGRTPVVVTSPGIGIGDGGTSYLVAATNTDINIASVDGSNAANVGGIEALALGWDSTDPDAHGGVGSLQFGVHGTRRQARIISGQVDATAAVNVGGTQFTVEDLGAGDYVIHFSRAFAEAPTCVVTVKDTTDGASSRVYGKTPGSVSIATYTTGDSPANLTFNFVAYGFDTKEQHALRKGPVVQTQMRKPRLLAFKASYSAGVPTLDVGTGYGAVTDTAEGQITVTYSEPFAREPIVLASASGSDDHWVTVGLSDVSSARIDITDSTGVLGDPTDIDILVLGSDELTEF